MEQRVYTVAEFAELMRISKSMAYKMVRTGQVKSIRFGDRFLISDQTVNTILSGESCQTKTRASCPS